MEYMTNLDLFEVVSNVSIEVILLMEEILHQLRLVVYHVYPIIYRVLYIPGGAGFLPSTVLFTSSDAASSNGKSVDETTRDNKRPSRQKSTIGEWAT